MFSEAATRGVLLKKVFFEILQNSQENICARASFLINLQNLAQMFSCEFYEIFKNIFFIEHLRWLLLKFQFLSSCYLIHYCPDIPFYTPCAFLLVEAIPSSGSYCFY